MLVIGSVVIIGAKNKQNDIKIINGNNLVSNRKMFVIFMN
jgi:hypothetical protein